MLKKLSDCLRRHTFLCCVVLTGMLVLSVVAGISLGTAKISLDFPPFFWDNEAGKEDVYGSTENSC